MSAVEKTLEKADANTSMKALWKLGSLEQPGAGPTDPADVERQQSLQLRKAKSKLAKEEARVGFDRLMPWRGGRRFHFVSFAFFVAIDFESVG